MLIKVFNVLIKFSLKVALALTILMLITIGVLALFGELSVARLHAIYEYSWAYALLALAISQPNGAHGYTEYHSTMEVSPVTGLISLGAIDIEGNPSGKI